MPKEKTSPTSARTRSNPLHCVRRAARDRSQNRCICITLRMPSGSWAR
ncbi:hypothetical protein A7982_13276 [Minicystis rosea]|nr:hypothetical protein A7982_13276 [Minicystis rosea]